MADVVQSSKDFSTENALKPTTNRRAARGRTAALLSSSSDEEDNKSNHNDSLFKNVGIYAQKLHQTKQDIKDQHHKFDTVVESKFLKSLINYLIFRNLE